jgi:hypothetical protein
LSSESKLLFSSSLSPWSRWWATEAGLGGVLR